MLIEINKPGIPSTTVVMSNEVIAGLDLLIEATPNLAPCDYLHAIQHMLEEQGWVEVEDDIEEDEDEDDDESGDIPDTGEDKS